MFTCVKSTDSLIYYYCHLKSVYNMAYIGFIIIENFIRVCAIGSLFFSDNETRFRIGKGLCYV